MTITVEKAIVSAQIPIVYQLERLAAEHDRTLSAEVRRAIERYFAPPEPRESA